MARTLATLVCLAVAALSALPAAWDVGQVAVIALSQLGGAAQGTDFLNLYSGAYLFLRDPAHTYDLAAQLAVQQSLTQRDSLLVPFYLPPHAALLVAWLGGLPYGVAYVVWLAVNITCFVAAVYWLAPRPRRLWGLIALLFLPTVLTLGQGQTSLVFLLALAAFTRGGEAVWTLKPQLGATSLLALALARKWRALTVAVGVVGALTLVAALRLGPTALAQYRSAASDKTAATFQADPVELLGPTAVHASRWFLGTPVPGLAIAVMVLLALAYVWRRGLASDPDARLAQLALIPLAAVLAAPYALVYELTTWLASFWLLWRATENRPRERTIVLLLVAPVWAAANVGVALPREGGADFAALFGLALYGYVVVLSLALTTPSPRSQPRAAQPGETWQPTPPARQALPR